MREDDAAEVQAFCGLDPLGGLMSSLELSAPNAWSWFFRGELAAMFGVVTTERPSLLRKPRGIGWLLTSTAVDDYPKQFWRASRATLPSLLEDWSTLENYIDARHTRAIRWALRLGFHLEPPAPFGVEGRDFCRFCVRLEDLKWER